MSDQNQNTDAKESVSTKEPIRLTVAQLKLELETGLSRKELAKKFGTNEKQITNIVAVAGLAFSRARPAIILVDEDGAVIGTSLQTAPTTKPATSPVSESPAPAAPVVEPVVEKAAPVLADKAEPATIALPKVEKPAPASVEQVKPMAPAQQPVMSSAFVQPTGNVNNGNDPYGDLQVRPRKPLREF